MRWCDLLFVGNALERSVCWFTADGYDICGTVKTVPYGYVWGFAYFCFCGGSRRSVEGDAPYRGAVVAEWAGPFPTNMFVVLAGVTTMEKSKNHVIARSAATWQSPALYFSAQLVYTLEIPTRPSE